MRSRMRRASPFPAAVALFFASLLAVPAVAVPGSGKIPRSGPLYFSSGAIETVQTILRDNGYLEPEEYAPGTMDQPTIDALRRFQREHYLKSTGLIDPETMGLLTTHGLSSAAGAPPSSPKAELSERGLGEPEGEAVVEESADWVEVTREDMEEESVALAATVSEEEASGSSGAGESERCRPQSASREPMRALLGAALLAIGAAWLLRRQG
ncbi:MAG: peptidoglycan-binding domain-containing protein [Acidobacteriota bacterium]